MGTSSLPIVQRAEHQAHALEVTVAAEPIGETDTVPVQSPQAHRLVAAAEGRADLPLVFDRDGLEAPDERGPAYPVQIVRVGDVPVQMHLLPAELLRERTLELQAR